MIHNNTHKENLGKPVSNTGFPSGAEISNEGLPQLSFQLANQFLSRLDSEAEFYTFQTFDDNSNRKNHQLAKILHGTLEEHFSELTRLQKQGAGVFVTINATNREGRTTKNVEKVRAFFVDLDGAPLDPVMKAPIEPHLIIESSPKRYHAYWFVGNCPLDRFSRIQKELATLFGGDSTVNDLPRVMRLPGFIHLKNEPFMSYVLEDRCTLPVSFEVFEKIFGLTTVRKKDSHQNVDPTLEQLKMRGMVKKEDRYAGCYSITCPWVSEHSPILSGKFSREGMTAPGDDFGTKYYQPGYNGFTSPGFQCFHKHCQGKSIKDLLTFLQKNNISIASSKWDDPIALPEGLPPVTSLDETLLPNTTHDWILDIADRMQIPPDFSAASSMVVIGSLIGRRCGIHPKEKDDWLVIPNLWGAIIGRPSLLKSPAIAEVMKPLELLIVQSSEEYEVAAQHYNSQKLIEEARNSALKEKLKGEAKKGNASQDSLETIAREFGNLVESIMPPFLRRYKTEDGTVEKIGEILNQNPEGILVHRDELIGWLKSLDRYGREGDRAFYLESWNGTGSFTVDRITRGTLRIPALCLSILGGIQPGPLSAYIYQATSGGGGDDGLLQRLQMTVWPDFSNKWVNVDRWPDTDAKQRACEAFQKLATLKLQVAEDKDIPTLRFSPGGQQVFNNWRSDLEKKLRSGDLHPALESHLAKYRSLMPSLALNSFLVDAMDNGEAINEIPEARLCKIFQILRELR